MRRIQKRQHSPAVVGMNPVWNILRFEKAGREFRLVISGEDSNDHGVRRTRGWVRSRG
jgi:hypothetical protein